MNWPFDHLNNLHKSSSPYTSKIQNVTFKINVKWYTPFSTIAGDLQWLRLQFIFSENPRIFGTKNKQILENKICT